MEFDKEYKAVFAPDGMRFLNKNEIPKIGDFFLDKNKKWVYVDSKKVAIKARNKICARPILLDSYMYDEDEWCDRLGEIVEQHPIVGPRQR